MIAPLYTILLGATAGLVSALPTVERRVVTSLNTAAFNQAQQRDATATRAFSGVQIKTGTGQCLFVDELSGDFRANLTPIQVAACDSSAGQQWDIITKGKHNDVAGTMLIVSALTQACGNFDARRAAGNQVLLFSCGGRADGAGQVTNSQLFSFSGGAGPQALAPKNAAGSCFTVKGKVVDIAACNAADPNQQFSFGSGGAAAAGTVAASASNVVAAAASSTAVAAISTTDVAAASSTDAADVSNTDAAAAEDATESAQAVVACATAPAVDTSSAAPAVDTSSTVAVAVAATAASTNAAAATTTAAVTQASAAATTAAAQVAAAAAGNPTTLVPVSRAGGVLNPSSAAEANPFDNTATRAFTGVQLKSANGQCLFIDPTAGDFRQNLIPIQLKACDGSANTKFDFITAGKHNNAANSALIVSSLMNGCLNFDNRRAAGDTVITFACGGRADGQGSVTNSQLFTFAAGETSLRLQPENGKGAVCLVPNASGRLDQAACSTDPGQLFTIG